MVWCTRGITAGLFNEVVQAVRSKSMAAPIATKLQKLIACKQLRTTAMKKAMKASPMKAKAMKAIKAMKARASSSRMAN